MAKKDKDRDSVRTSPHAAEAQGLVELAGVVLAEETRHPISEATVSVFSAAIHEALSVESNAVQVALTDARGRFSVRVDPTVPHTVAVRHPQYEPWFFSLANTDDHGESERVILLMSGGTITGTVQAEGHGPVRGARVLVARRSMPPHRLPDSASIAWGPGVDARTVRTDAKGRFEVGGLSESHVYTIRPMVEGMVMSDLADGVAGRVGDDVEFMLEPAGVACFRLIDAESGSRIEHLSYMAIRSDETVRGDFAPVVAEAWWGGAPLAMHLALPGSFVRVVRLRQWPVGRGATAEVHVRATGYEDLITRVPLQAPWGANRSLRQHEIPMKPQARMGRVHAAVTQSDGTPVPDEMRLKVRLADMDGEYALSVVPTIREGIAEFRLPVGSYSEFVPPEGSPTVTPFVLEVVPGGVVEHTWVLQKSFAAIRVIDERDRQSLYYRTSVTRAHVEGDGPVEFRLLDGQGAEGQKWPLAPYGDELVAFIGPFNPGRRSFRIDAKGYESVTFSKEVSVGTVKQWTVELIESEMSGR